ncbi:MAG: HU family DNA-binding protein [Rickettsiaceae bacterium H1]|nr:HU family DNA-binding protein [Rickettsiaceae bacterium H1]
MSKNSLIRNLKSTEAYNKLSESYIKKIISIVFDIIGVKLNYKGLIKVKEFGSFMIKKHNVNSDDTIYTIKFKASKNLLDKVN